jgi:hypothetical protein
MKHVKSAPQGLMEGKKRFVQVSVQVRAPGAPAWLGGEGCGPRGERGAPVMSAGGSVASWLRRGAWSAAHWRAGAAQSKRCPPPPPLCRARARRCASRRRAPSAASASARSWPTTWHSPCGCARCVSLMRQGRWDGQGARPAGAAGRRAGAARPTALPHITRPPPPPPPPSPPPPPRHLTLPRPGPPARQVMLSTAAKAFSSTTRVDYEGTPRCGAGARQGTGGGGGPA